MAHNDNEMITDQTAFHSFVGIVRSFKTVIISVPVIALIETNQWQMKFARNPNTLIVRLL